MTKLCVKKIMEKSWEQMVNCPKRLYEFQYYTHMFLNFDFIEHVYYNIIPYY